MTPKNDRGADTAPERSPAKTLAGEPDVDGCKATLDGCIRLCMKREEPDPDLFNPDLPTPFEGFLAPFVMYARHRLEQVLTHKLDLLGTAARLEFERALLTWLSYVNAFALETEFSLHRAQGQRGFSQKFESPESQAMYKSFVNAMLQGGLREYFNEYPVAGRLTALSIQQWVDAVAEFVGRFYNDQAALADLFNTGHPLGHIVRVNAFQSDRHHGGRSVIVLACRAGMQLVYKPKDLSIEKAYNGLVQWLNSRGNPVPLRPYAVLPRAGYGWAEFIDHRPIREPADARHYYQRAGAILCLAHLLGATDMHYENIVMSGADPMLIDIETLLHPFVRDRNTPERCDAIARAEEVIAKSVIRTGLLPGWIADGQGRSYDASGFGEFMVQHYSSDAVQWSYVNTNRMRSERIQLKAHLHPIAGNGAPDHALSIDRYADEFVKGFSKFYRFLIDIRPSLLRAKCWRALRSQETRFVFRSTKVYAQVQQSSFRPALLKDVDARQSHLRVLYRGLAADEPKPYFWPVIEAEMQAMDRMDVPHFCICSGSDSISFDTGQTIGQYFSKPGFDNAVERLRGFSEQDLLLQTEFIRGSLACRTGAHSAGKGIRRRRLKTPGPGLQPDEALLQSVDIATMLLRKAVVARDGSVGWIAPKLNPGIRKYQLQSLGFDLYDGTGGIAIYFAALYNITGEDKYREAAAAVLQMPMTGIAEGQTPWLPGGGFTGWGSLLYTLVTVGKLLGSDKYVLAAASAAKDISSSSIAEDRRFDLMHGCGGSLLGAAAVYETCKDETLMEVLNKCGNHLLSNMQLTATGRHAWPSREGIFLTGFSHGAAGIAYALMRLCKLSGDDRYKQAAFEAIGYENNLFDAAEANWPDLRQDADSNEPYAATDDSFMCAWCHGAAGIGLSRLAIAAMVPEPSIERDIDAAVQTTKRHGPGEADHLCCGHFGRLDFLLSVANARADQELLQYTLQQAGALVHMANASGSFRYHMGIGMTPGFFQGASGIGYELLRMAFPGRLPSVLTMQ